jgi:hypothetical protein
VLEDTLAPLVVKSSHLALMVVHLVMGLLVVLVGTVLLQAHMQVEVAVEQVEQVPIQPLLQHRLLVLVEQVQH